MKLMHEVRGLRNNNPGNLEKSSTISWDGQVSELPGIPDEPRFCQFSNVDYGIRAIFRILKTYREKYGLDTIEGIINRYAPPGENDTNAYINAVIATLKECYPDVAHNAELGTQTEYYPGICIAIIKHENGFCPFTIEYIKAVFEWGVPEWQEQKTP